MKQVPMLSLAAAAMLTLVSVPLSADWVVLKDGKRLQGIDYRKLGARGYLFTLETGKRIFIPESEIASYQGSLPGETVEFRGKKISLRGKIRILRKEEMARRYEMMRNLEKWALGGRGHRQAKEKFLAVPREDREPYLSHTLARSSRARARLLAARRLRGYKTSHAAQNLASAVVQDRNRGIRIASIVSLQTLEDPNTADYIIPFLKNKDPIHRIRAADALAVFPDRRAVPALIAVASRRWTDFGRCYFFQGTQRSYIADYELVSGGTGFSLVELADPIIDTVQTGVVLDVKITEVEIKSYLRALRRITGEDFGGDLGRWNVWWNRQK